MKHSTTEQTESKYRRTQIIIPLLTIVITLSWLFLFAISEVTKTFGARFDTFPDVVIFPVQTALAVVSVYSNSQALQTSNAKWVKLGYTFSSLTIAFVVFTMINYSVFWGYWFS